MEERRKRAYQWILVLAINELRGFCPQETAQELQKSRLQSSVFGTREVVKLSVHLEYEKRLRMVGDLAYAFHNLPEYAMRDFDGWNEEVFWDGLKAISEHHDFYGFFKGCFDQYLNEH